MCDCIRPKYTQKKLKSDISEYLMEKLQFPYVDKHKKQNREVSIKWVRNPLPAMS